MQQPEPIPLKLKRIDPRANYFCVHIRNGSGFQARGHELLARAKNGTFRVDAYQLLKTVSVKTVTDMMRTLDQAPAQILSFPPKKRS